MLSRANGDVAVQGSGANFDSSAKNDVDSELGLGDSAPSAFGRLQSDAEDERFRIEGFALNESGDGVLVADYGDIPAGTAVESSLGFYVVSANWNHALMRGDDWRLGLGAQVEYFSLDIAARSATGREETAIDALVPMPHLEAERRFGNISLGATLAGIYADVGDAKGRFLDGSLLARWSINSQFQLFGGYRYILLDAKGKASDRNFDADLAIDGLFFGCGVRF